MIIDNFIEKIVENSDRKFIGIDSITEKEFLADIKSFIGAYCECWKISESDFYTGKELFKTLNYYLKSDHKDILFKGLSNEDRETADSFYSESLAIISEQEEKYPDFDGNVICQALENIIHLFGTMKFDNDDEVTSSFEEYRKGNISIDDVKDYKCRIGDQDFDETIDIKEIKDIIEGYKIYDNIDLILKKTPKLEKEINIARTIADKLSTKKGHAGTIAAIGILSFISPAAVLGTTLAINAGSKRIDKTLEKQKDYTRKLYRFFYWRCILLAVYNNYCKDMEG